MEQKPSAKFLTGDSLVKAGDLLFSQPYNLFLLVTYIWSPKLGGLLALVNIETGLSSGRVFVGGSYGSPPSGVRLASLLLDINKYKLVLLGNIRDENGIVVEKSWKIA